MDSVFVKESVKVGKIMLNICIEEPFMNFHVIEEIRYLLLVNFRLYTT